MVPESNSHLPRCVKTFLEFFLDRLDNHEEWILEGNKTVDSLHRIGLHWKVKQFLSSVSKFCRNRFQSSEGYVSPLLFCIKRVSCSSIFQLLQRASKQGVREVPQCYTKKMANKDNFRLFDIMTHKTLQLPPKFLCNEMKHFMAHKCGEWLEGMQEYELMKWKDTSNLIGCVSVDL